MTGRYISRAAAKSAAGIGTPDITRAHNRAISGFFVCEARPHLRIMVGRAGASTDAPGSLVTGSSNPVRLTTPRLEPLAGELSQLTREDARSWQPNTVIPRIPVSSHLTPPALPHGFTVSTPWRSICRSSCLTVRTPCRLCVSLRYSAISQTISPPSSAISPPARNSPCNASTRGAPLAPAGFIVYPHRRRAPHA
ncbi:hypothetical protein DBV23_15970 [Edwardsiella ictaluri]|nr:hypothetical protein DBV23_15970 [Edwardsiella ictaluri]EKS7764146.1 ash family protein [Edwardsiella ictaluri]EKS7771005.1 ash family protein [Edwardsiella ictaluri]EKS7774097.1 ash family protein [Edwardsiella ictaluri]EKS7777430.1 ash family protein [Edwardsiella ictaluri]